MRIERQTRGPWQTIVLRDDESDSLLEVAPDRGGMATRLRLSGAELLFLDEESFADPAKNVRGGIPVLFPNAGPLPGDAAEVDGRACRLPQHGLARRLPWRADTEADALSLELRSSPKTLEAFPFPFALRVRWSIRGGALAAEATIENPGEAPLPWHLGFHPYLRVADAAKRSARVRAVATEAIDHRTRARGPYRAPDLGAGEVDLLLADPDGGCVRLAVDGLGAYRLDYGGFPCVVLWSVPGRDFVCLEPWSAPGGALATGDGLQRVPPGDVAHRSFFLSLEE